MGNYSVPEKIRKLRPQGTMVKNIKGHYYVYEYSSTSVKEKQEDGSFKWKTKNMMGACIGQITLKNGFVPNGAKQSDMGITVFEYGDYLLIKEYASQTHDLLIAKFDQKEADQIFAAASIFVVEKFQYMNRLSGIFNESVLSKWYPNVCIDEDALNTLYDNLGRYGTKPQEFQQSLIDNSSRKVAIERHVSACSKEPSDLSVFEYQAKKLGAAQVSWMTAYDVETKLPLCNEMFNGVDPDVTAVEALFNRFHFENTLFLVNREFNTAKDKTLFSKNGNTYIVPMISGRDDYEAVYKVFKFDESKTFVYEKDGYSSLIYYQTYTVGEAPVYYHVFLDTTRQSAERQTYIQNMEAMISGYTEEGLVASEKDFGLFLLETNDLNKTAQEVFCDYKTRWGTETFLNYVNNDSDFYALCQNDSCNMQGLGFIVQIAGMIFHDVQKVLTKHTLPVKDVLSVLKGLKLVKERNRYVVKNEDNERRKLCDTIELNSANYGAIS